MLVVTLQPLTLEGKEFIRIIFMPSHTVTAAVRKCSGVKWNQSGKYWYLPLAKQNFNQLSLSLRGIASIDHAALREYLISKKRPKNSRKVKQVSLGPAEVKGSLQKGLQRVSEEFPGERGEVHPVNLHVLDAMEQHLKLKAYSKSTVKTYLNEMSQLLKALKNMPADELNDGHIKRYLVYCYEKLKLSENTLHSRINAMKFYYEQVLHRSKFFWDIPRPKRPLQLPKLLNEVELARLFNAMENKKHKAMLFTAYSAGLRVSEIVSLKIADVDSVRMQLFIGRAKGKKDRYVNLSPVLLDILRSYVASYQPRPKTFLFESEQTLTAYPVRTVQQIFSNARRKAGILKEVGVHSLRHSFATHLLDKGTDIKYIKDLLGHFNIKTTERYLHVSKKQLVNVISPFDDLWRSQQINW